MSALVPTRPRYGHPLCSGHRGTAQAPAAGPGGPTAGRPGRAGRADPAVRKLRIAGELHDVIAHSLTVSLLHVTRPAWPCDTSRARPPGRWARRSAWPASPWTRSGPPWACSAPTATPAGPARPRSFYHGGGDRHPPGPAGPGGQRRASRTGTGHGPHQHGRTGLRPRRPLPRRTRRTRLAGHRHPPPPHPTHRHRMIRVLLVDDQELIRAGLRGILREPFGFQVVGDCEDGDQVLAAIAATDPAIVLMDVRMPRLDGIAATRLVHDHHPHLPVLALTTFDDDQALAGMLRAGAAGFVLKGIPADELHRAVRTVAAGDCWLDPAVTARVLTVYRTAPASPLAVDAGLEQLTERERDVLTLIGQARTNTEIAHQLYIGEGTVKTHINHLFTKLGLRDRAAAVVYAYDHHLVRPGQQAP